MTRVPKSLNAKLAKVRIFLCDVDGVLTDGNVTIGGGKEYKSFFIRDGLGLLFLRRNGIKVGWISARPSPVTQQRAAELKIDFLHQEDVSKVQAVENLLKTAGFTWEEASYMGDDIVDLGVIKRAGVGIAVANAIQEAKAIADYVTKAPGGQGAVREVVEMILAAQNKWKPLVETFSA
jgi:3-deoxy-D-manno-octulosonate 8-phosphate phosphatase (KDO 8-P phosphatase)